jgi:hypothetical protein
VVASNEREAASRPWSTVVAAAVSFGAFFAFIGWYDVTGGRGWKGFAVPALTLLAGQGLGFPHWTWRKGLRLALAGVAAMGGYLLLFVLFIVPALVLGGLPIGTAYGWACDRPTAGAVAGTLAFNALVLAGCVVVFQDMPADALWPVPGVGSFATFGIIGGGVLGWVLGPRARWSVDQASALNLGSPAAG